MWQAALYSTALFGGMLAMLEAGRRLRRQPATSGAPEGVGTLEGAVFGLFGLLLAFSFSGAVDRFNVRRALIVREANAVGSAWSRLDVLPAAARAEQQDRFRRYLDTRIAAYRSLPDIPACQAGLAAADRIQLEIWNAAVASCLDPRRPIELAPILLNSLEEMSDVAMERTAALTNHPPTAIFGMLFLLSLLSSLLAGTSLGDDGGRRYIHRIVFALAVSLTIYLTIDLEYPRVGLIRVEAADAFLVQVRQDMK